MDLDIRPQKNFNIIQYQYSNLMLKKFKGGGGWFAN
jgi:hypothetical protein